MPLLKGASKRVRSANIAKMISEGRPERQAVAIAYSEAGEKRKKRSALANALKKAP